jgi:uncharacterized phiE125 gp8 family phage protein
MPIIYSKVTSDPAAEPVLLAEAKLHLRVENDEENALISILSQAAREMIEQRLGRSLITQSRTIKMDHFPLCSDTILLPYGPVQSVTSIHYLVDGVSTLLSALDYAVDTNSDIARIVIDDSWPSADDDINSVTIVYVCGYGASSSYVPKPIKQAIYMLLAHLYENRQAVIVSGSPTAVIEMPMGVEYLISPYVLEQSVMY